MIHAHIKYESWSVLPVKTPQRETARWIRMCFVTSCLPRFSYNPGNCWEGFKVDQLGERQTAIRVLSIRRRRTRRRRIRRRTKTRTKTGTKTKRTKRTHSASSSADTLSGFLRKVFSPFWELRLFLVELIHTKYVKRVAFLVLGYREP